MDKEKFMEELENKAAAAIKYALKNAKKAEDENDKAAILNIEFWIGQYQAYKSLMNDLDHEKYVELHRKYRNEFTECQCVIYELYH
jgi:hypothetical protein|nr:MAG TPA: hypothetical protein [Caudoviricetes sp.]